MRRGQHPEADRGHRSGDLAGSVPRPSGAERNKTFAKKVDAQRFLATVQHTKSAGSYVDPLLAKVTVGEWAKRWL